MYLSKRLETLEDFKKLNIDSKVILRTKKEKILNGFVDSELTNRGYIDVNEIDIYINECDCSVTVNVDKYLNNVSSIKDFILIV
jgi:hypothetical protein